MKFGAGRAVLASLLALNGANLLTLVYAGEMPKPAPPIRRSAAPSTASTMPAAAPAAMPASPASMVNPADFTSPPGDRSAGSAEHSERAEFVVRPKSEPLSAQVSKMGAGSGTINGGINLIRTEPALSAGLSKRVPAEVFRAWLQETHPKFALSAGAISQSEVVVVKGAWDDAGKTLKKLGIPFQHIRSGDLDEIPLDRVKVLIIDCAGKVPKSSYQKIRDYVARGGYLLATDWALDNFLVRTFPGYVEWDRKMNSKPVYDAEIVNPDAVLFNRVVTHSTWKLDEESHLVHVLKPNSVRVLARSRGLAGEDPLGDGVLALSFGFGRGTVLHMVGHFDNNAILPNSLPDPAPIIGISMRQAIASNFVVAGLQGTRIP